MFIQHNDLIDDSKLPPNSYYQEPRDNEIIKVRPNETLDDFISRVVKSREEKGYPLLNPKDTRFLVVASIERSTPQNIMNKYFEKKALLPGVSQAAQLAKLLVAQSGQQMAGYNQRQERALKCIGCALHKANNQISEPLAQTINKTLHAVADKSHETLADLQFSDLERKLGQCGMCGCGLQGKVRIGTLSMLAGLNPSQLDRLLGIYGHSAFDACWILSEALKDGNLRSTLEAKLKSTRAGGKSLLDAYLKNKHLAAARKDNDGRPE